MVVQSSTDMNHRSFHAVLALLPLAIILISADTILWADPELGGSGNPPNSGWMSRSEDAQHPPLWAGLPTDPRAESPMWADLPTDPRAESEFWAGLPTRPRAEQRPYSAYSPAPRPLVARRMNAEQLIQSNQQAGRDESTRRPPVVSLLEQLAKTRGQLQNRLDENANWNGSRSPGTSRHIQDIESLLQTSHDKRRQHEDRMNLLLERLEAMIMAERTAPPENPSPQTTDDDALGDQATTQDDEKTPSNDTPPSASPIDAAGRAVDRLRLADSLFGSEKYQPARDIYLELLESSRHAEDRVWIEFQIASCYKNLHDMANAGKYFRLVVGADQEVTLTELARWWLTEIQELETVRTTLDQLTKTINEVGQKKDEGNSLR